MKTKYINHFLIFIVVFVIVLLPNKEKIKAKPSSASISEMALTVIRVKAPYYAIGGTFTDARDNRKYKQIKIGNQVWMAENLNYGKLVLNMEQTNNNVAEKTYYKNDSLFGKKFGALYTWEEVTNYTTKQSDILEGLCPDGWHLPSDKEWSELSCFLDNKVSPDGEGWLGQNIALLMVDGEDKPVNFGIKYAGNAVSNWFFYNNEMAYFWTSSSYSKASAWCRSFSKDSKQIYRGAGDIKLGMSVRCVKD